MNVVKLNTRVYSANELRSIAEMSSHEFAEPVFAYILRDNFTLFINYFARLRYRQIRVVNMCRHHKMTLYPVTKNSIKLLLNLGCIYIYSSFKNLSSRNGNSGFGKYVRETVKLLYLSRFFEDMHCPEK